MKMKKKLFLSYGALLIISIAGLLFGLISVLGIAEMNERVINFNVRALDTVSALRASLGRQQLVILKNIKELPEQSRQELKSAELEFRHHLAKVKDHAKTAEEKRIITQLEDDFEIFAGLTSSPMPRIDTRLDESTVMAYENVRAGCLKLYEFNIRAIEKGGDAAAKRAHSIAWLLGMMILATLIIGLLVSSRLANLLGQPLDALAQAASRVAAGDFEAKVARSDIAEIRIVGQQFNAMTEALSRFRAMNIDAIISEQRRNAAILSSIDDGLVICDSQGTVLRINDVGASQIGCEASDCLGKTVGHLFDRPELNEQIRRSLLREDDENAPEPEVELGEGDKRRVLSYSLLPFSDGEEIGLVMVLRDITNLKAFQALRTEFVLRASHELRTPMTSMRMALGMLSKSLKLAPDSREQDLLDTLNDDMQRMTRLLSDLLDLSRMYARELNFDYQLLNVCEFLGRAVQRFEHQARSAGIDLSNECSDLELEVRSDAMLLDRVLDNLLSNALRHTPAGGNIRVGGRRRGQSVEFYVADSGEGIAPNQKSRVFEPFVQIGRKVGGAGLGLAMCKEIVEQQGGQISLRSVYGKGSIFTVRLSG